MGVEGEADDDEGKEGGEEDWDGSEDELRRWCRKFRCSDM